MKLTMSINYEVQDTDAEAEAILEEIVADEARVFVETVRRRLAEAGVTDLTMDMSEKKS